MKSIFKISTLTILFAFASCAHHGGCGGQGSQCNMHKEGKGEQCKMNGKHHEESGEKETAPATK